MSEGAAGEGGALYYDKFTAPPYYHLIFALPLAIQLVASFAARSPLVVPLLSMIPLVLVWLLFAVLRVSVTRKAVRVQYGLFGPTIPIEAISRCEPVDYEWKKYGGWGIRFARDGSTIYNMLGDKGRAVKLVYTQGGRDKTVLLSSRDPERLALAVSQAKAEALSGGRARVATEGLRIEGGASRERAVGEAEAEAERDDEKPARRL